MRNLFLAILSLLPLSVNGFDYSSYESGTFDNIVEKSNAILKIHVGDEGIEIMSPTVKVTFHEKLVKMPYKCSNAALFKFMKIVGSNIESFPPINYCVEIESKSGVVAKFHIQDTLVSFLRNEVKVGENFRVWALWIYSNGYDGLPYFLINEFQADKAPNKLSKGTHNRRPS